jgi:hypothetical protein
VELIAEINNAFDRGATTVPEPLLRTMFEHIGDPDPQLRDETIFERWSEALFRDEFAIQQKELLLDLALNSGNLSLGIKEGRTDKSFTRSFTALLLASLLENNSHTPGPWLTPGQTRKIFSAAFNWLSAETDNRGFVEGKGWLHCFGHGGDLLWRCAETRSFTMHDAERLLCVVSRAFTRVGGFHDGEGMRLLNGVVESLGKSLLYPTDVVTFLDETYSGCHSFDTQLPFVGALPALSFRLRFDDIADQSIQDSIEGILRDFYKKNEFLP